MLNEDIEERQRHKRHGGTKEKENMKPFNFLKLLSLTWLPIYHANTDTFEGNVNVFILY